MFLCSAFKCLTVPSSKDSYTAMLVILKLLDFFLSKHYLSIGNISFFEKLVYHYNSFAKFASYLILAYVFLSYIILYLNPETGAYFGKRV